METYRKQVVSSWVGGREADCWQNTQERSHAETEQERRHVGSSRVDKRQAKRKQVTDIQVVKKQGDGQNAAERNVADRQETQTFRQEASNWKCWR
jgi:hypothetical protein